MRYLFLSLLFVFTSFMPLSAGVVNLQELSTLQLDSPPKQVTSTADGRRMYVLTKNARILVYTLGGALQGSLDVDPAIDKITPLGPKHLLLQKTSKQQAVVAILEVSQPIDIGNSPLRGNPEAAVTIAIYDDFECPYCARAVPIVSQVLEKYADRVNLAFKNFPLANHRNARNAALTALAADRQGKFWQLHDLLYENYNRLNPKRIDELAAQAGVNMDQLKKDRDDPQLKAFIERDINEGKSIGVRGTPTIFINGRLLQDRSLNGFSRLIEEELARVAQESEAQ